MESCNMCFIYICDWEDRLTLWDKLINNCNWSCVHACAGGCVHRARSTARDWVTSQTLSCTVPPPCCSENKVFKLTASNRPSTIRHTPLLTAEPGFALESELLPRVSFDPSPSQEGYIIVYKSEFEGWPCRLYRGDLKRRRLFTTFGKQAQVRTMDSTATA
jgi:hypothetical protein